MTMARSCGPGRCTVSTGTPSSVTNVAVVTTGFTALHSDRGQPVRALGWRRRPHIPNDLRPPDMPRAAHLGHLAGWFLPTGKNGTRCAALSRYGRNVTQVTYSVAPSPGRAAPPSWETPRP